MLGLEYDGEEFHPEERKAHDEARREWIAGRGWIIRTFRRQDIFTASRHFEDELERLVKDVAPPGSSTRRALGGSKPSTRCALGGNLVAGEQRHGRSSTTGLLSGVLLASVDPVGQPESGVDADEPQGLWFEVSRLCVPPTGVSSSRCRDRGSGRPECVPRGS